MPVQLIRVPGTNTIHAMFPATILDEDLSGLWNQRFAYRNRGVKTKWQGWTFDYGPGAYWPIRRGMGFYNDPLTQENGISSSDMLSCAPGDWEPWSVGWGGTASQKFIMGTCYDQASSPISGAIVQGFLTSTDFYVGATTADSNGRYEFGTPYALSNHYLVAYRAGAPDIAGTTVDTLQGTNRDGT